MLLEMFEANAFPRVFRLVPHPMPRGALTILAGTLTEAEREALLLLLQNGHLAQYWGTGFLARIDPDGYDHVRSSASEKDIFKALEYLTIREPRLVARIGVEAPLPDDGPPPVPGETRDAYGLTATGEDVVRYLQGL